MRYRSRVIARLIMPDWSRPRICATKRIEPTIRKRRPLGAATTTWNSAPDRQTDGMPTREAVEQAYAEYDRMMAEAWKKA